MRFYVVTSRQDAINLKGYLSELVSGVVVSGDRLEVQLVVEAVQVDRRKAVSIGLLVNEPATNLVLQVSNTGSTIPEHIDLNAAESLGLQLITGLVEQLGGSIEFRRRVNPCFEITFPT